MKELLRVMMDAKQIREACEEFVGKRLDHLTERATAQVPEEFVVLVLVTNKRASKPKGWKPGDGA